MLRAFVLILFINSAFSATQIFVPNLTVVDAKNNGYELESTDSGYQLVVKNAGGSRVEYVEEVEPGELLVNGQYKQKFEKKLQLVVKYIAGRDGYVAGYQIRSKKKKSKKPKPTDKPQYVDKPDFPTDDEDDDKEAVINIAVKIECLRACVG